MNGDWIGSALGGLAGLIAGNAQNKANQANWQNNYNQAQTLLNQQMGNAFTRLGESGYLNPYNSPMGSFMAGGIAPPSVSSMSIDPSVMAYMMNPQQQYQQIFGGAGAQGGGQRQMGQQMQSQLGMPAQLPPWLRQILLRQQLLGAQGGGQQMMPRPSPVMQRPIMPGTMRPMPGQFGGRPIMRGSLQPPSMPGLPGALPPWLRQFTGSQTPVAR